MSTGNLSRADSVQLMGILPSPHIPGVDIEQ